MKDSFFKARQGFGHAAATVGGRFLPQQLSAAGRLSGKQDAVRALADLGIDDNELHTPHRPVPKVLDRPVAADSCIVEPAPPVPLVLLPVHMSDKRHSGA